jgi:2',3'-cyclic-nucleotide 2'-phosphodiesterase (5'-nucleotidase family)
VLAAQGGLNNAQVRSTETEAGNIVADAVREAGSADIGLVPSAAFKVGATASNPANAPQVAGLIEPSSDTIVVMSVRGDRVLAALERSVSFVPQPSAGFLQVSGIKFDVDPKKGTGQRVSNVTVDGKALGASQTYKVAMTRPLSVGQQGYFQVWDKAVKPEDTNKSIATALEELARARGGSLSGAIEGRINIK